ncbi:glycogen debranching protein GlgX [Treponema sp. OMZ 840]|uniref:glycogen debranching protein GlgX n=1 Tax=Treponema sp. OMZ 840 TaxID=244313 RepID=UPI003D8B3C52
MLEFIVQNGKPVPFGANPTDRGVNFSVFSRSAESVSLAIFSNPQDNKPCHIFNLDPHQNRTGDIWHIHIHGLSAGALYLYQVDGPFDPEKGHRFDKSQFLIDPYAKALTDSSFFAFKYNEKKKKEKALCEKDGHFFVMPKCVVIDDDDFDWQGDKPLNYPLQHSIIYETHLKGFTQNTNSEVKQRGTYRGFIEKIPYLKSLGVTSVEFLPVQEFDENENTNINPKTKQILKNYWGYSTISFFAPKVGYAADKNPGACVAEFKEMVREMHKNGLEVILDIVFNHTAEGNEKGFTLNFRGFENSVYYMLEEKDKRLYKNFSGCGNTMNCNHPAVRTYIIDCLRYWVSEMHVDGFRFDLGSILGRDTKGRLMENPPMLERIAEDPLLRNTKIIAEAWDGGGAYQVGSFPGGRWAEWNDRFRDDIRRFWRGDKFFTGGTATRLAGSSDLYLRDGRKPFHSINFLTSHDGFTLNDLVSYKQKHNKANGEDNRDGLDNNYSCNYGHEGASGDPEIESVRKRQIKNMILTLFLSQGTPMLLGGDEFRRTQNGNNNAYCQDNELSWFDWDLKNRHEDIFSFTRKAIAFRMRHPAFRRPEFFLGQDLSENNVPDISWFDHKGNIFNWDKQAHFLACLIDGSKVEIHSEKDDNDFYLMCNAGKETLHVKIPDAQPGKRWYRCADTSFESPNDFFDKDKEAVLDESEYALCGRTMAVLIAR